MYNLTPKAIEIIKLYDEIRWPNSKPRKCYQDLPKSKRLSYELLSWDNYEVMLDLFEGDSNPFVMPSLRIKEHYDVYAAYQLATGRYSGKHGTCDWFLKLGNGNYVGVLHLYEVNFELFDGVRYPCYCGYAIAEPYRRQGFAEEALRHLIALLPTHFKLFGVKAEPLKDNKPSIALLKKVGFKHEKFFKNECGDSVLLTKTLVENPPKLSWEEIM